MKKTLMAMCFLASSYALLAQNTTTTNTVDNTITTTGSYQAYGTAPSNVQMYFNRDYPTATNVTWMQNSDWWRASYNNNGRFNHVYYNTAGDNFLVALPVTTTWVPDNIITQASNSYGVNLYDITTLRGGNGQPIYQIRILENGTLRSEYIDQNGAKVTDIWRTVDMNQNYSNQGGMNNTNSNPGIDRPANTEMKFKQEGNETKLKVETDEYKMKMETEGNKTKTKIKKKKTGTTTTETNNNQE